MLNQIAAIHGTGVAASTNSYESIATVTVGAGGSSSVDFTSIAGTYKHLQIRGILRTVRGNVLDGLSVRLNGVTTSTYTCHELYGDGAAAQSGATTSTDRMLLSYVPGNSANSNVFGGIFVYILDYANTNKNKTLRGFGGFDNNGSGYVGLFSGLFPSTNAVTSITLAATNSASILQYSSFALYGIKG